jgi:aconitate hydratase
MTTGIDPFGTVKTLQLPGGGVRFHSLPELERAIGRDVSRMPKTVKVLLESALRNFDGYTVREKDIETIASWHATDSGQEEVSFKPARVVLQDFTGVPVLVDLAAMREACITLGGDPRKINPLVPCDLVIDHSVQVDYFGRPDALQRNLDREFERNGERYAFLKWGQQALDNFSVVPPGTGIVHQVNLEYLASVVRTVNGLAFPDSLVGTDSHTTMINGLGVVGWGVGGIEAEAVMLGQPVFMLLPRVTGVRLTGRLREGVTATDLVLTVTRLLRGYGVVGDFVEFFGPGFGSLTVSDRATVANMAPEYGATTGFFPVDRLTIEYLGKTGRSDLCSLVERYCREQGLWHEAGDEPDFTRVVDLHLDRVEPSLSGPRRPQDRIALSMAVAEWKKELQKTFGKGDRQSDRNGESMENEGGGGVAARKAGGSGGDAVSLQHGSVVIAAITSCTNTSNPQLMIAAGIVAREAVRRGLKAMPWVKTSLAPGSRVVTDYLDAAGLSHPLDALGFSTVGYGCTTCIGNSGPLPESIASAVETHDLVVCAVLSGNRNFEGRINPHVKASYLASPPLVVAYALAGRIDIDFSSDPLGVDSENRPVFLRDLWPSGGEVERVATGALHARQFTERYRTVNEGPTQWQSISVPEGALYTWDEQSTYIRKPPFFDNLSSGPEPPGSITGARCLALFGDGITTDHISPAGAIGSAQPAGEYLLAQGIAAPDFNSFGSRRGNHEVMTRGTFDNIRIRNLLVPDTEGGFTAWLGGEDGTAATLPIHEAAMRYRAAGIPLVVLAGNDYGMGSSRDWAAKGTMLLGVKAVIACSYERIHRSNLVGMGVLPLQFLQGETPATLGLSGREVFDISLDETLGPGQLLTVNVTDRETGLCRQCRVVSRLDTPVEVDYYRNGGILPAVLRRIVRS